MTREQFELPFPHMPRLTHFGYSACVDRYTYEPHYHFGYEFIYVTRGKAEIELFQDKEPITFQEDDICIIAPRVLHEFKLENQSISFFWMGFQTDSVVAYSTEHMHVPTKLLKHENSPKVEFETIVNEQIDKLAEEMTFETYCHFRKVPGLMPVFASIYEELQQTDAYSQQIIYQKILELFTRTARLLHTVEPPKLSTIAYIREYLEAHCRENVDLGAVAVKAGYSQEHMSRAFKELYHVSPKQYHDHRRLQAAKEQLAAGASVRTAAAGCGFGSGSYFSAWFRKLTGDSPRKYQQEPV